LVFILKTNGPADYMDHGCLSDRTHGLKGSVLTTSSQNIKGQKAACLPNYNNYITDNSNLKHKSINNTCTHINKQTTPVLADHTHQPLCFLILLSLTSGMFPNIQNEYKFKFKLK
jgi:hypothetical protein